MTTYTAAQLQQGEATCCICGKAIGSERQPHETVRMQLDGKFICTCSECGQKQHAPVSTSVGD